MSAVNPRQVEGFATKLKEFNQQNPIGAKAAAVATVVFAALAITAGIFAGHGDLNIANFNISQEALEAISGSAGGLALITAGMIAKKILGMKDSTPAVVAEERRDEPPAVAPVVAKKEEEKPLHPPAVVADADRAPTPKLPGSDVVLASELFK